MVFKLLFPVPKGFFAYSNETNIPVNFVLNEDGTLSSKQHTPEFVIDPESSTRTVKGNFINTITFCVYFWPVSTDKK